MIEIFHKCLKIGSVFTAMMKKHGVAQQCTSILTYYYLFIHLVIYLIYF